MKTKSRYKGLVYKLFSVVLNQVVDVVRNINDWKYRKQYRKANKNWRRKC